MLPGLNINSEITRGNLGLELVLRALANDRPLNPSTGYLYILVKTTNDNYGDFLKSYQTRYNNGQDRVQTNLTTALSIAGPNDTFLLTQGNWSGNYETPLNAVAPFCQLIGVNPGKRGVGPWMLPSDTALPMIDLRARGWRVAGIEFEGMTGAAAIRATKIAGLTQRGADFFEVDHNIFSGGKTGVEFNGGGTYWKISDNDFTFLTTAGGAAIYVSSSSYQIPALGNVFNNHFVNNIKHIYAGGNAGGTRSGRGFSDSVFEKNKFMLDGVDQNATCLLDIRGGAAAAGNMIIDNFFDVAHATFDDAQILHIANTGDCAAGNHFEDADQSVVIRKV